MFCPNCGKSLPDDALFCPACGTKINAGKTSAPKEEEQPGTGNMGYQGQPGAGNMGYQGQPETGNMGYQGQPGTGNMGYQGQPGSGNNGYYGNAPEGAYQNQDSGNEKKMPGGLKVALCAIAAILVFALAMGVTYFAFTKTKLHSSGSKEDESASALSSTDSTKDDAAAKDSAATASTSDSGITGENALSHACDQLASAKGTESKFSYSLQMNVQSKSKKLNGDFSSTGDFSVETDLDPSEDNVSVLEKNKGTVKYTGLDNSSTSMDMTILRGNQNGDLMTYIESEDKTYSAKDDGTADLSVGFSDYMVYDAQLQDKTQTVDGVECYVYVAKDTYDQGGLCGIEHPVTGYYMEEQDKCTVTIYVSKNDGTLKQVETVYDVNSVDLSSLDAMFNRLFSTDDMVTSLKNFSYDLTYSSTDKDVTITDELSAVKASGEFSPTFSDQMVSELDSKLSGAASSAESASASDGTASKGYSKQTLENMTYEIPEKWDSMSMDDSGANGYMYYSNDNISNGLAVMFAAQDLSEYDESMRTSMLESIAEVFAEAYGAEASNLTETKIDGQPAVTITFESEEDDMKMEAVVFVAGDGGFGILSQYCSAGEEFAYQDAYSHLLKSVTLK